MFHAQPRFFQRILECVNLKSNRCAHEALFKKMRNRAGSACFSSSSAPTADAQQANPAKKNQNLPRAPSFDEIAWHKAVRPQSQDPQAKAAAKLRDAFKGQAVNKVPYARCNGLLDRGERDGFCSAGAPRMQEMI